MNNTETLTHKKHIDKDLNGWVKSLVDSSNQLNNYIDTILAKLEYEKKINKELEDRNSLLRKENEILSLTLEKTTKKYDDLKSTSQKILEDLDKSIEDLSEISESKDGNS